MRVECETLVSRRAGGGIWQKEALLSHRAQWIEFAPPRLARSLCTSPRCSSGSALNFGRRSQNSAPETFLSSTWIPCNYDMQQSFQARGTCHAGSIDMHEASYAGRCATSRVKAVCAFWCRQGEVRRSARGQQVTARPGADGRVWAHVGS